jgi:hypothetical protein
MEETIEQVDPKREEEFKLFLEKLKNDDLEEINDVVTIDGDLFSHDLFLSLIRKLYPKRIPSIPLYAFHIPITDRSFRVHEDLTDCQLFCVSLVNHTGVFLNRRAVEECSSNLIQFMLEHKKKYICVVLKEPEEFGPGVQRRLDLSKYMYYRLKDI